MENQVNHANEVDHRRAQCIRIFESLQIACCQHCVSKQPWRLPMCQQWQLQLASNQPADDHRDTPGLVSHRCYWPEMLLHVKISRPCAKRMGSLYLSCQSESLALLDQHKSTVRLYQLTSAIYRVELFTRRTFREEGGLSS
jgi:hypothetical protein